MLKNWCSKNQLTKKAKRDLKKLKKVFFILSSSIFLPKTLDLKQYQIK